MFFIPGLESLDNFLKELIDWILTSSVVLKQEKRITLFLPTAKLYNLLI